MSHTRSISPHEAIDMHELVNFKTLSLAKSKLMQGLAFDQELKDLMQQDVEHTIKDMAALRELYSRAPFQTAVPEFRPEPIIQ